MLEAGTAQTFIGSIVTFATSFSGLWVVVAWLFGIGLALWIFEYLVDLVGDNMDKRRGRERVFDDE